MVTNETGRKQLVAIDGKSCRSSHDRSKDLGPLHIVSAWATEEGLALGQVAADDKSNEITAIPQLLSQLSLRDAIVTIDAIGCQKNIVEQIDEAKGTYVIAVKENQPTLAAEVRKLISEQMEGDREELLDRSYGTREKGHGRIDERTYRIMKLPQKGSLHKEWPSVKAIGYATRITHTPDGDEQEDTRFYISNAFLSARRFAEAVRGHWGIESMHWVLDVNFREDENPTAERSLANNLSWLRRFAIGLLKRVQDEHSLRGRMQMAGWSTDVLEKILLGQ
ncbi:MAG: ISAs1 family transposase [Pirellulales bacterium]